LPVNFSLTAALRAVALPPEFERRGRKAVEFSAAVERAPRHDVSAVVREEEKEAVVLPD
jgi:hypothetical protein